MTTCTPESHNISYMLLNLQGEVGELSGKLAKAIRKGQANIGARSLQNQLVITEGADGRKLLNDLILELGDVIWQAAGLAEVLGYDLETVCERNLEKLAERHAFGTIVGDGDGTHGAERRAAE